MPPRISRRTVPVNRDAGTPTPTQRRPADTPDSDGDGDGDGEVDMEASQGSGSVEQLAKSLVRYALSCEMARRPIKRQDVNERVLGLHARLFKAVLEQANSELMDVFGMQFAELPRGDKVTVRQKRAAAGADSQTKASGMWVLQTVLPQQYRLPEAIGPGRRTQRAEDDTAAAYVGLYTMVIALIVIAGGRLPEGKLDRALKRMNAEQTTPVETKDKTLGLMIKDGYIVRVRETVGSGEETVDYIVGPRGKVEVGAEGFAQLMRRMYGGVEGEGMEELEKKIQRTLDVAGVAGDVGVPVQAGRKRRQEEVEEDDEDDEDE